MKVFQPFRLDAVNRRLWRDDERLPLTPKAFDVLSYLVEHRTRLVTQHEILEAVWTDTHVNPEVVKKAVLEIRRTLGDRPDRPAFIALNPFYHLLSIARDPLIGQVPPLESWLAAIGLALVGCAGTVWLYRRAQPRIAYWV